MNKGLPIFLALTCTLVMFACKNEPTTGQKTVSADQPAEASTPAIVIEQTDVLLLCQPVKGADMDEMPEHEVFLQLAESKVKVADILNCETISPDVYSQYQIPATAISAAGGWWAGAGDYLYVIEEAGNFVVRKGWMEEMQSDSLMDYEVVVKYSKTGKEVF